MVIGAMVTVIEKRPLVLLHKCSECATFALAPMQIAKQQQPIGPAVEGVRQKFSRFRVSSAPAAIEHNFLSISPENVVFEEDENEDKRQQQQQHVPARIFTPNDEGVNSPNSSSGTSGHSSPDESPSPTSVDERPPKIFEVTKIEGAPAPMKISTAYRHRSVSECEGIATSASIKGILKRRPVFRSLSECIEENGHDSSSPSQYCCRWTNEAVLDSFECVTVSGESGDDDQSTCTDGQTSKKTVRFNDRVQENVFRPNSSILGQRKKNQRKQKSKRKRTNSNGSNGNDSQASCSENETDPADSQLENDEENHEKNEEENEQNSESKKENEATVVIAASRKRDKNSQVKKMPSSLDDRYSGFVFGSSKITKEKHRRTPSGDSALGDDESENFEEENNGDWRVVKNTKAVVSKQMETKDSGIDE